MNQQAIFHYAIRCVHLQQRLQPLINATSSHYLHIQSLKPLHNMIFVIAKLKQQISVPLVHENVGQTLREPNLAPQFAVLSRTT
ncbi:hypothetical protein FCV25MIE_34592 [Fagus crenata]